MARAAGTSAIIQFKEKDSVVVRLPSGWAFTQCMQECGLGYAGNVQGPDPGLTAGAGVRMAVRFTVHGGPCGLWGQLQAP